MSGWTSTEARMQELGHVRLLRTKPTKPLADGGPSWRIPKGNLLRAPAVAPRGLFVSGHLAYLDHLMFRAGRFHRAVSPDESLTAALGRTMAARLAKLRSRSCI